MTGCFCVVLREKHASKIAGCDTVLFGRYIPAVLEKRWHLTIRNAAWHLRQELPSCHHCCAKPQIWHIGKMSSHTVSHWREWRKSWKVPVSISILRVEIRTRTSQIIITSYVVLLSIFGSWKPRQGNALTDESSTSKQEQCLFHFNSYRIFKCVIDDKLVLTGAVVFKLLIFAEPL